MATPSSHMTSPQSFGGVSPQPMPPLDSSAVQQPTPPPTTAATFPSLSAVGELQRPATLPAGVGGAGVGGAAMPAVAPAAAPPSVTAAVLAPTAPVALPALAAQSEPAFAEPAARPDAAAAPPVEPAVAEPAAQPDALSQAEGAVAPTKELLSEVQAVSLSHPWPTENEDLSQMMQGFYIRGDGTLGTVLNGHKVTESQDDHASSKRDQSDDGSTDEVNAPAQPAASAAQPDT